MTRLAIDIVILPPDHVMKLAIEWNQHLAEKHPQEIILGRTEYVPHISLLMGCLSLDRISAAETALKEIANSTSPLDLEISGVKVVGGGSSSVVTLDIVASPALSSLHRKIADSFTPLLTQDATASEIDDSPPISPSSIGWINNFMTSQCNENFWPHITVGHGESEKEQEMRNFKATCMSIFHLGNHCTCKRLLFEAALKK